MRLLMLSLSELQIASSKSLRDRSDSRKYPGLVFGGIHRRRVGCQKVGIMDAGSKINQQKL
jgi:hypothetical protein